LNEKEPPPDTLEAKVEIFFFTFWLLQAGQTTSLAVLLLRTSSSKGLLQSEQTNSKIGINDPPENNFKHLDAEEAKKLQHLLFKNICSSIINPQSQGLKRVVCLSLSVC
jgi:hypothetical protein